MIHLISEDEFLNRANKIPLQKVPLGLAEKKGIDVFFRRDDLIDESLSGNKFYKLFYNLNAAKNLGHQQLLTYGGAYSNHIYAVAAAARLYGFSAIGVIRGERPKILSPTLADAQSFGMRLHFVSRSDYRDKNAQDLGESLQQSYGDFFEIPEGGANAYGALGAKVMGQALSRQVKADYTSICVASGTANTLAGIAAGVAKISDTEKIPSVIGFSVLKGDGDLGEKIIEHQKNINVATDNWRLISGYHCGGYGKKLPDYLRQFIYNFEADTGIPLDPVYTAKMCWGVAQLIAQNYWPHGSKLILVHTGGLQGRRGFNL